MAKDNLLVLVKACLEQVPETRDSDNKLLYAIYRHLGVDSNTSFERVINKVIRGELPAFASITRAKRKVVELYPHLDCSAKVRELRDQQEQAYKSLAKVDRI